MVTTHHPQNKNRHRAAVTIKEQDARRCAARAKSTAWGGVTAPVGVVDQGSLCTRPTRRS